MPLTKKTIDKTIAIANSFAVPQSLLIENSNVVDELKRHQRKANEYASDIEKILRLLRNEIDEISYKIMDMENSEK